MTAEAPGPAPAEPGPAAAGQLWVMILQDEDAGALLSALLDAEIEAYTIASSGGFLGRGSTTVLAAVGAEQATTVRLLLDDYGQTRSELRTAGLSDGASANLGDLAPEPLLVTVTGAVVFTTRLARLERL